MAEKMGLLGKKLGMTQVFMQEGQCVPVTVIQTGPCVVTGLRTLEKDGYSAVQLGFDEKPQRLTNRPEAGQFKNGLKPVRVIRELRLPADEVAKFEIGQELNARDVFPEDGRPVDIQGTTKGKGFQGVMKRHGMAGTKASHGVHEFFRHGGSIGCRLTPGRVKKGKRMGGQMGGDTQTVQGMELVAVMEDQNVILVRGAIPGAKNSYVLIKRAAKKDVYRRRGMGGEQARSKNPLKASKRGQGR